MKRTDLALFTLMLAVIVLGVFIAIIALTRLAQAQSSRLPYHVLYPSSLNTALTADNYIFIGGGSNGTTFRSVAVQVPADGIVKELRCRLDAAMSAGASWTISLQKEKAPIVSGTDQNVATGLTCTIAENEQTCSDLVNSAPVATGDSFALLADETAGAASIKVRCSVILFEYQ